MYQLLSRSRYIQLIHVGKAKLQMDDDVYRSFLIGCTGKDSCKDMGRLELDSVLELMKSKGFKIKKKHSKSNSNNRKTKTQLDKLRQLWIAMNTDGYLKDGSDQALLSWSKNQAKRLNKNVVIENLEWLQPWMLGKLIEQLKQWYKRCEVSND